MVSWPWSAFAVGAAKTPTTQLAKSRAAIVRVIAFTKPEGGLVYVAHVADFAVVLADAQGAACGRRGALPQADGPSGVDPPAGSRPVDLPAGRVAGAPACGGDHPRGDE